MNVTIYTTESCGFCKAAKAFLKRNHIAYTEYDVGKNPTKAQEMIRISGQTGVPVILIGKKMIIGFDQDALEEALESS